jgi:transcriptional regulator
MYVQPPFSETRSDELHALIRANALGTLVVGGDGALEANHIPFLLNSGAQTLTAHLPRANEVWKKLNETPVLVIFHGPNSYISPSAYPSKEEHGKAVPTWNYAVVHTYGTARIIDDKTWLRNHLDALTATHEIDRERPWRVADAPAEYIEKLLAHIVGLEISVERFVGKFKLGQNRSQADQFGVVRDLESSNLKLAKMTREHMR